MPKVKQEEEEEVVAVGEGADVTEEELEEESQGETSEEGQEEETEESEEESSEESEEETDQRAGHAEGEGSEEEERERKRAERQARKDRQRRARDRDQRELNFLRSRNEQLEKRFSHMDERLSSNESFLIDQRISQLDQNIKLADSVIAEAVKKGAGEDVVEAQRIRDELKGSRDRLKGLKDHHAQETQQRRRKTTPDRPSVSQETLRRAKGWMERNSWYDPKRGDDDSAIAGAIDDKVISEGFDPETDEYWEELDRRLKKRLPHKFKKSKIREEDDDEDDDEEEEERPVRKVTKKAKGGPRFAVGGRERPLRANEVHISRERREAMIEAGVWDDPVLRQRYLKRYREYDREHRED